QLQRAVETTAAETDERFDESLLAMCRCTREGVLTRANRALADLIGYQGDGLQNVLNPVSSAFEAADDLSSLVQRCVSTGTIESIERRWKRADGGRLDVRLSANATSDAIEIAVEDLSNLRALEARLARAHRMEAVGRLASEVAVTCGNLLRDVSEDGQTW